VFCYPDTNPSDPGFGQVTSTMNTPRQIQFTVRFTF